MLEVSRGPDGQSSGARKSSIRPPLAYFILEGFEGGLIREWCLINYLAYFVLYLSKRMLQRLKSDT